MPRRPMGIREGDAVVDDPANCRNPLDGCRNSVLPGTSASPGHPQELLRAACGHTEGIRPSRYAMGDAPDPDASWEQSPGRRHCGGSVRTTSRCGAGSSSTATTSPRLSWRPRRVSGSPSTNMPPGSEHRLEIVSIPRLHGVGQLQELPELHGVGGDRDRACRHHPCTPGPLGGAHANEERSGGRRRAYELGGRRAALPAATPRHGRANAGRWRGFAARRPTVVEVRAGRPPLPGSGRLLARMVATSAHLLFCVVQFGGPGSLRVPTRSHYPGMPKANVHRQFIEASRSPPTPSGSPCTPCWIAV